MTNNDDRLSRFENQPIDLRAAVSAMLKRRDELQQKFDAMQREFDARQETLQAEDQSQDRQS